MLKHIGKNIKKIFQNSKSIQVDFNDKKSVKKFIDYLSDSWEFNDKTIKKVFDKYSGKIKRYSPRHATLMYELIKEHFDDLSDEQKLGYISSRKTTFAYLGDSAALEFFATFFVSVFTSAVISSTDTSITALEKLSVIIIPVLLATIIVFIKSALKPKFYHEIITTVENKIKE